MYRSEEQRRRVVDGKLICGSCRELKPVDAFTRLSTSQSGYEYSCRSCKYNRDRSATKIVPAEKRCPRCATIKSSSLFYKSSRASDGLAGYCKACSKAEAYKWRDGNPERFVLIEKRSRAKNAESIKARTTRWRAENKDYLRQKEREAYANNVQRKLSIRLRNRLNKALNGQTKSGSAVRDLGCSIEELKSYLESKFQPGMSWDNHGAWHIDHVIPLAAFDLTVREQHLKACHFTNLQPLWAHDNLRKNDSIPVNTTEGE